MLQLGLVTYVALLSPFARFCIEYLWFVVSMSSLRFWVILLCMDNRNDEYFVCSFCLVVSCATKQIVFSSQLYNKTWMYDACNICNLYSWTG